MSEEYTYHTGSGCMGWILLLSAGVAVFLLAFGGDYESTRTDTRTRSGVLSGNQAELLSRNQFNAGSTVVNCFGDWSCSTVITTTATSETTQTTSTSIDGDRNAVQQTGGMECYDAAAKRYTPEACQGGQP